MENLNFGKGFAKVALVDGDRRKQIRIDLVSLFSLPDLRLTLLVGLLSAKVRLFLLGSMRDMIERDEDKKGGDGCRKAVAIELKS